MNLIEKIENYINEGRKTSVKGPGKLSDGAYLTSEENFFKWYNNLSLDDYPDNDVVLDETGEVIMRKGETRRKKLKLQGSRPYDEFNDKSFESIKDAAREKLETARLRYSGKSDAFFEGDFEDLYIVETDDIYKVAGVDKDEFMANDYDVESSMPKLIMRRDKRKFTANDEHNIKLYIKFINDTWKSFIPNMSLGTHVSVKGKTKFEPEINFN